MFQPDEHKSAPDLFEAELALGAVEGAITTLSVLHEDGLFQQHGCPENEAVGYVVNQLLEHSKALRACLFPDGREAVKQ